MVVSGNGGRERAIKDDLTQARWKSGCFGWCLVHQSRRKNLNIKTAGASRATALLCVVVVALQLAVSAGCATSTRKRMLIGVGAGAGLGVAGGALLSPNSESRGINTLVFGLMGALAGGLATLLLGAEDQVPPGKALVPPLTEDSIADEHYITRPNQVLPAFVRQRLVPVVVEELTEPDTVGEDGTLHEPHKVYRIKRQAELIAHPSAPTTETANNKQEKK